MNTFGYFWLIIIFVALFKLKVTQMSDLSAREDQAIRQKKLKDYGGENFKRCWYRKRPLGALSQTKLT